MEKTKCLFIDNDIEDHEILQTALTEAGYTVEYT